MKSFWRSLRSQRASPAMTRVLDRIRLHAPVPLGKCLRKVIFLSGMPQPATAHGRSRSHRITSVDDRAIYLVRACGLRTPSSPVPGIGLGGLVPRSYRVDFPSIYFDSRDIRAHRPRMRMGDVSAPMEISVALCFCFRRYRQSPSRLPVNLPCADTDTTFASIFTVPLGKPTVGSINYDPYKGCRLCCYGWPGRVRSFAP